jgi:hypothetical protein
MFGKIKFHPNQTEFLTQFMTKKKQHIFPIIPKDTNTDITKLDRFAYNA